MIGARRAAALLPALVAIGVGGLLAGCGGDQGPEVTVPTISVEETVSTEATGPTKTAPDGSSAAPGTGGTPSYDPDQEDSPTNDKPPDPGSPEEQFENFCKQNPGACG